MIWKLCGIVIVASGAYVFLKKERPEYAFLAQAAGSVFVFLLLLPTVEDAITGFTELFSAAGIQTAYIKILIRCLGIALLTKMIADLCRDSGESAMAAKTELGGKVLILLAAVPVFESLMDFIRTLLENT